MDHLNESNSKPASFLEQIYICKTNIPVKKGTIRMSELQYLDINLSNTIDTFIAAENVQELLKFLNIRIPYAISIIKETQINRLNKSVMIGMPDPNCSGETDIFLNIKQGQPTVDQVFNAIYRDGWDCQQRIIAFTGGDEWDDKFNPSADTATVKCLIDNMNRFDLNVYMVQVALDSTSSIPEYEVIASPASSSEFHNSQCPSFEKFTEAEFWEVYLWGYNNWVEATPFEFGFDSDSQFDLCYPVGNMNIVTKWTGEGAIISIEDTNDNNKNELDVIWNRMKNEILDMFRGCDIELLIRAGAVIKLRVTVFDKPIGDLAGTPWREKRHYAGLMWTKFMQCYEFFERALQDLKTKK